MKVQNMTNANGKAVPNQFIIRIDSPSIYGNFLWREVFQSYNSVIAIKTKWDRLKNTVFPTGLRGKCASALVTGQGYNPRKYTLIITDTYWTFR